MALTRPLCAEPAAERAVLSAALSSQEACVIVVDKLKADDFTVPTNRAVFEAIADMLTNGSQPDLVTVVSWLEQAGRMDEAGGFAAVSAVADDLSDPGNAEHYCRLVLEASHKRVLTNLGRKLIVTPTRANTTAQEIADEVSAEVLRITERTGRGGPRRAHDVALSEVQRIEDVIARRREPRLLRTGYPSIDALIGGFEPDQLIVLAALTGVGKTALALNIATNLAEKHVVLFHTLEMSDEALVRRVLARHSGISVGRLRHCRMTSGWASQDVDDRTALRHAVDSTKNLRLWIDSRAAVSLNDVRTAARRLQLMGQLDLIVVDYLQLMAGPRSENRTQQVSAISRGLKNIAKDLQVPVLALSQLARTASHREGELTAKNKPFRHRLEEIRESGSIEQDSDVVMFIVRDTKPKDAIDDSNLRTAVIQVAKQRDGPTGECTLTYVPELTEFKERGDQ